MVKVNILNLKKKFLVVKHILINIYYKATIVNLIVEYIIVNKKLKSVKYR